MQQDFFRHCSINIYDPEELKSLFTHRPNWVEYFMLIAKLAASRSTCLSRPAGAVIVKDKQVLATGYNGSMPGVNHCTDDGTCYRRRSGASDEGKYDNCRSTHAEANALAQAARHGISIGGAEMYMTLFPCYVCTKLLATSGIKKVYYEFEYKSPDKDRDIHWREALDQAGIEFEQVEISDITLRKVILSLVTKTSWRRALEKNGKPTGKIENVNSEEIFK